MVQITLPTVAAESRVIGSTFLVVALCLCVLAQILGSPITLNSLIAADLSVESVSDGCTIPTPAPEHAGTPVFYSAEAVPSSATMPLLPTSIFHPPQA